jgi:hypothetical protein
MKRMHEILGIDWNPPYATNAFEENVTIEQFDENVEDED